MRLGSDGGEVVFLPPKLADAIRFFTATSTDGSIDKYTIMRLLELALIHLRCPDAITHERSHLPVYNVIDTMYEEIRCGKRSMS